MDAADVDDAADLPHPILGDDPATGDGPGRAEHEAPTSGVAVLWPTTEIDSSADGPASASTVLFDPRAAPGPGGATVAETDLDAEREAVLLDTPIDDGDLARSLAGSGSRRGLPWSTLLLSALLLAGLAFTGGVLAEKAVTPASAAGTRSASGGAGRTFGAGSAAGATGGTGARAGLAGGSGGGTGGGPGTAAGGFGAAGAAAFGTIQLVDGSTIYVQGSDGTITKVLTGTGTTFRVTTNGTVKDLAPGTIVVIQGTKASDGTVRATGVVQGGARGTG